MRTYLSVYSLYNIILTTGWDLIQFDLRVTRHLCQCSFWSWSANYLIWRWWGSSSLQNKVAYGCLLTFRRYNRSVNRCYTPITKCSCRKPLNLLRVKISFFHHLVGTGINKENSRKVETGLVQHNWGANLRSILSREPILLLLFFCRSL